MNQIQINGLTIETDGTANIRVSNGKVFVNDKQISKLGSACHKVIIKGNVGDVQADGSVEVTGNVDGDIDAGGHVTCGDVSGSIDAGGHVTARNVKQNVDAGGHVRISR
jgi:hypothetical protein